MNKSALLHDIIATYEKHGWRLRQALLKPETKAELHHDAELLEQLKTREADVDAVWFSRPSHKSREAWELRLLAETQYALFETFESDETEEQRNEVKLEMESRLRDYANRT
jgi:hypothetical protein